MRVSRIYLGEDGGPDGLNLLDLGGGQDGLDLVGLHEELRLVGSSKLLSRGKLSPNSSGRVPPMRNSGSLRGKPPLRGLGGILHRLEIKHRKRVHVR